MDNTFFENKCDITKEDLHEYYSVVTFHTPCFITITILYGLSMLVNILGLVFEGSENFQYIISNTLCFLILIALLLFRNHRWIKIYFARSLELGYGQKTESIIKVSEDFNVIDKMSGSSQHIEFNKIAKCKETKHFIFLMTKTKYCLMFKKDSFTEGTLDEFIEFIHHKYPAFKIKKSTRNTA